MMNKLQWIENKIMDLSGLVRYCQAQKVRGRKIVFTNGCFDILHHGHIDLLAQAASQGDILIVMNLIEHCNWPHYYALTLFVFLMKILLSR
jgi:bifunctional ADP-heptose synthase (sugar kinase/adenylyltransferase)